MRISDWSSDVCSSDLSRRTLHRARERPLLAGVECPHDATLALALGSGAADLVACAGGRLERADRCGAVRAAPDAARTAYPARRRQRAGEIGRASCRARVGQYV